MNVQFDSTSVLGDSVTNVNVFEDSVITGGQQTLFGIEGPVTVTDGIELPNFIDFYDIDFDEDSFTLTLVDNSGATDPIIPEGRFDRHYIEFEESIITSASLDGSEELNEFANVEVLEPGFMLEPADVFGTGISTPIEFENGGLLLELGEGSDFTNTGVSAKVNFTSEPTPEPTSVLGDSVTNVNVFEDSVITGGQQTLFGIEGPVTVTDGIELPNFINFYDVDFDEDSFTLTLVDNSGATDPIIPEGRFDRHYIEFEESIITSASLDGSEELNEFANVEVLEPGFMLEPADVFGTGISTPIEFENGGLLLELGEGSDFTNTGVSAKVNFTSTLAPEPPENVFGDIGDNDLFGSEGNDRLYGNGGNDVFNAESGDDTLYGGHRNDSFDAGNGDDIVYGNGGHDVFVTGDGNDILVGGTGNDSFDAGNGDDIVYGNGGDDLLVGGSGDDLLYGGSGSDRFEGGLGNDELWLNGGNDVVVLTSGDGRDIVHGFQTGQTTFELNDGLSFDGLSFSQGQTSAGDRFTQIFVGDDQLAQVNWVSETELNNSSNFTVA